MGLFHQFIPVSPVTSANLQHFMAANGLDNKAFAALAGVDPSTIRRIVTDPRCEIRSDTRQKLTTAIGCTWSQLRDPGYIPEPLAAAAPESTLPGTANLPIGAVAVSTAGVSVGPSVPLGPPISRLARLQSDPPREIPVRGRGSFVIRNSQFSLLSCRRAPLATWLLNSWRAWLECFTWRALLRPCAPSRKQNRFTRAQLRAAYRSEFITQEAPHVH